MYIYIYIHICPTSYMSYVICQESALIIIRDLISGITHTKV